jgi:E3 ubiquitin-protein ligase HECTD1
MSCTEETNSSYGGNKISASGNTPYVEAITPKTNLLVSSSSSTSMNKALYGSSRGSKVQLSSTADPHTVLSAEAVEVLDKMREGADLVRNNTNSFLSGELLPSSLLVGSGQQPSSATSIGNVTTAASFSFLLFVF